MTFTGSIARDLAIVTAVLLTVTLGGPIGACIVEMFR